MPIRHPRLAACALVIALPTAALLPAPAQAAMAVIDVNAIRQLQQQVAHWRDQLRGMSNQLAQLQQTHGALTGGRGMERLLAATPADRNYLPASVADLAALGHGGGGYAALTAEIARLVQAQAVLPAARLARLSPAERRALEATRDAHARAQALMGQAYAETSGRFAQLQDLIDAIGGARDAKAIADLQGRIAAEQAMLANEHTKLFALAAVAQAEADAAAARRREQALVAHGSFASRFQPTPPRP